MFRLICKKPAHFLSAQMALVIAFFQMFIVLGMYNFGAHYNASRNPNTYLFIFLTKKTSTRFWSMYWEFVELCGELLRKYKNLLNRNYKCAQS